MPSEMLYRLVCVDRNTGERTRPVETNANLLTKDRATEITCSSMAAKLPHYFDMEPAYQQPTLF